MKKIFILLSAIFWGIVYSQSTINGSFNYDGDLRTYSFYVPASYTPGNAVPLVIGLHGTSSSGSEFAQYRDFRPIADTANFIMVNPDGTTMLGISFWNYGNVFGSTVDDVGFLEALVDTISAHYTINPQRVYCTGMSNGSFMSYCMACESDKFAAVAGVTGSMSTTMYNACIPGHPTPTLHIHGTDDGINPYEGTSSMVGIDQMNRFWVDQNNCDTTPVVFNIPDVNTTDNSTATRYVYENGTNGNTVELFKVNNGGHSWPGGPMPSSSETTCMDFNASVEIWRFFSQYELDPVSVENYNTVEVKIWPNPTSDHVYLKTNDHIITEVVITDIRGNVVDKISKSKITSLSLAHLATGAYILKISGSNFQAVKKIIISAK